jgi:hypothetical protein
VALVGNRSVLLKSPGRNLSGTVASIERNNYSTPGQLANRFQALSPIFGGLPSGHLPPSSWAMPRTAGALSAINAAAATLTPAALVLAEGRNVAGAVSFAFSLPDAGLQLVVSATGTATITLTVAGGLAGALDAVGASSVAFTLPAATLGAIISAEASATAAMSGSATARAVGTLAGDITPFTELSPQSLAAAVWGSIIEAGFSADQVLRILAAHAAGAATGLEGAAPAFTGLDGATVRIQGTYGAGTRTITALDGGA